METQAKIRVAILGGGPGALSAAFALTQSAEARERYAVTVYQQGWRLGGKCASGRTGPSKRIIEHGLHMLLGFYDTTFRIMSDCYQEWDSAGHPFESFVDAVEKQNQVTLQEQVGSPAVWRSWNVTFPAQPEVPGGKHGTPSVVELAIALLEWTARKHRALTIDVSRLRILRRLRYQLENASGKVAGVWSKVRRPLAIERAHGLALGAHDRARARARPGHPQQPISPLDLSAALLGKLLKLIDVAKAELDLLVRDAREDVRHDALLLRLAYPMLSGLIRDVLMHGGDYARINHLDFRAWLQQHGASASDAWSAPIKGLYDLGFAYVDGVTDEAHAQAAAGVALYVSLRMLFSSHGALLWKMKAGAGDTLFAPMYEVLRERGVRFEFFHRVTELTLADGKPEIETIRLSVQAATTSGAPYRPLIEVPYVGRKGTVPSWPAEPLWNQIKGGDHLRRAMDHEGISFESFSCDESVGTVTLRRGEGFDVVVLGISVHALQHICPALIAKRPAWKRMVEDIKTVQTQSLQLWMRPSLEELGWPSKSTVSIAYVEPLDSWGEMSHLLPAEKWAPDGEPRSIQYFCSAMPNTSSDVRRSGTAAEQLQIVRNDATRFLNSAIGHLWSRAVRRDGSFDDRLVVARYERANFDPSERYVLSVPGSISSRLPPDSSTFANLYLAGDWVMGDINSGSLESAMQSGVRVASAIQKVRWHASHVSERLYQTG
jgi:uncharacterized protein with NAD-binding domain and iron-sulfur cluster